MTRSWSLVCLITRMVKDQIRWHEVLLPINHNYNKICHELSQLKMIKNIPRVFASSEKRRTHSGACVLVYTAVSRKVVGKNVRDNPERHCGWFWAHCSSEKFERIGTKDHENVFASANGKEQSRFDSYSRQEQYIDHIPYYLSGLSRAHFFRQTFSK